MKKTVLDTRHGESFEGDVRGSTLTEKLGTRNAVDEIVLFIYLYLVLSTS